MSGQFVIYMHTSPSGKSYIGQTRSLSKRNSGHRTQAGCRLFAKAIKKYGWENFEHAILAEGLTLEEANTLEERLIAERGTRTPGGYNIKLGGKNMLHSEETKRLMSIAATGKKKPPEVCEKIRQAKQNLSAETRLKMSLSAQQRKISEEGRKRLSAARLGKSNPISQQGRANISAASKVRVLSDAARAKMSIAKKGKPFPNPRPMTQARKENLRQKNSNPSDQTREKISAASKAAWAVRKADGAHHRTQESIAKMLVSRRLKKAA